MKDPLKPRDKITQKMTRDGAITENQTTGETERISKRTQDAEFGSCFVYFGCICPGKAYKKHGNNSNHK